MATKLLIVLGLLVASFAGGYFSRTPETVTKVETKTDTVTVDRVVTKVITVKETSPDKAVKETTTTEVTTDKTVKQVEKVKDKQATPTLAAKARSDYSLGLKWRPDWRDLDWKPTGSELGYRALGDFWVTAEYDWVAKSGALGLRYEF